MSNIENLGAYGEFTKAAKAAGGVEPHLHHIKQGARMEGGGIVLVVVGAVLFVNGRVKRRRAEKRLKDTLGQ